MANPEAGLNRKRTQGGGNLYTTVKIAPAVQLVGIGAYRDAAGNAHFTLGACRSPEGNSYLPILDVDVDAATVTINGQQLIVP